LEENSSLGWFTRWFLDSGQQYLKGNPPETDFEKIKAVFLKKFNLYLSILFKNA